MSGLAREIISRTTLGLIALALLYGSYVCVDASVRWKREWREKHPEPINRRQRDMSGSGYAMLAGIIILPIGLLVLTTAVVPSHWLLRIFRLDNTLHENPSMDNPHGPWR